MQIVIIQPGYKGKVMASCDKFMKMCSKDNDRLLQKQCFSILVGLYFSGVFITDAEMADADV